MCVHVLGGEEGDTLGLGCCHLLFGVCLIKQATPPSRALFITPLLFTVPSLSPQDHSHLPMAICLLSAFYSAVIKLVVLLMP